MRISLIGRVTVELDDGVLDETQLLGRQGRLFFAYLVAEHGRPVPRDELAEALWGETPPVTWEKALTVLASKLRRVLAEHGVADPSLLTAAFGCYRLELPEGTWVDVLEAASATDDAEQALGDDDLARARERASLASSLLRRPFLPGEDGTWVEAKRRDLADVRERALAALADANLRAGDASAAADAAEQLITLAPLRESGYRRLMEAHAAAGNRAEALGVYERCRQLLADELGAYPSPETEAIYRGLLELPISQPAVTATTADRSLSLAPSPARRGSDRRRRIGLAVAAFLVLGAGGFAVAWASRDEPPPEVLPDSLVRIDANTLEPTDVFPVGAGADIVVASGGYVWVMHHVVRDVDSDEIRNAGDHTVSRVDPSTGEATVVGGGLAPCGITADPSGDVWVANCYAPEVGQKPTVVRVDAETLDFERTWAAPSRSDGFIRGLAYGGGSLWLSDIFGGDASPPYAVLQIDPETGARRSFPVNEAATGFGWSEGYGDLWINHFGDGKLSRLHPATEEVETIDGVAFTPIYPVVNLDTVWTADWSMPRVVRVPAVGTATPKVIDLPGGPSRLSYVWDIDAGAGAVWAVTPRLGSLWKIDPETDAVTRVRIPYLPSGVAVDDDAVWVTVRAGSSGP
ncbi:MAG: BTAD domain-containing putative transcriptional regulator [Acidimicrobiia bacterium]